MAEGLVRGPISQNAARAIYLKRLAQPKPPEPKHPDVQKALDNYPSVYPQPKQIDGISNRRGQYREKGKLYGDSEWTRPTYQEPKEAPELGRLESYYLDGKRPTKWPNRWA
jgi:hypothetical protein